LQNKINLSNRLQEGGEKEKKKKEQQQQKRAEDKTKHSKAISSLTDVFKQTRIRKKTQSKYNQERKAGAKGD